MIRDPTQALKGRQNLGGGETPVSVDTPYPTKSPKGRQNKEIVTRQMVIRDRWHDAESVNAQ